MVLQQILCLKTIKNETQRLTDNNHQYRFFISFYACPQDLSKKVESLLLVNLVLFYVETSRSSVNRTSEECN